MQKKSWLLFGAVTFLLLAGATYYSSSSISANEGVNEESTKASDKTTVTDEATEATTETDQSVSETNEVATKEVSTKDATYPQYSDGRNINYGQDVNEPMFRDLDIPETATNTAVVKTWAEMRTAILNVNINYIYMASNITITNSAQIPYAKKYMKISGKDPTTGEIHTLTESKTAGGWDNIFVNNTTTQNEVTSYGLEDIKIDGYNYYGPINVNDSSYCVTLNYTNVVYNGPQITHNLNGTTEYNNMDITIPPTKAGSTETQELVEGHYVEIYGKFNLFHEGRHSIVWIGFGGNVRGVDGHFRIKKDADVKITSVGRSFFYFESKDGIFEIEENANVDIVTGGGLVRDDAASSGRALKKIDVAKNASLKITRTTSSNAADNALPSFKMKGNINVAEGARFYLYNESASAGQADEFFRFYSSSSRINIDKAKSVLIYNPKGRIMSSTLNGYTNNLNAEVESMNLWSSHVPTGKVNFTPDNHFSFPDRSYITFSADVTQVSPTNYTTVVSNANPLTIDSAAMNFTALKVISMGVTPEVTVNGVNDADDKITGTATIDGDVVITYDDGEGKKVLTGVADRQGNYSIPIPDRADGTGAYIKPYTSLNVEVFYDFRTAPPVKTEVVDVSDPSADPVITIIDKDTPIAQFPTADTMVTNVWDKSLNTSKPKMTIDYGTVPKPDLTVMGPVLPKFQVTVTDEAKHSTTVDVPIFIKDTDTEVSKDKSYALRGVDFEVENMLYPKTATELTQLVRDSAEVTLWDVFPGSVMDVSNVSIDTSKLPNPLNGEPALGTYPVTLSYGTGASAVTKVINVTVIPSEADVTVSFVNEVGSKLHEPIVITGKIGSKIDLTQQAEVQAALVDIKDRKYELTSAPSPETGIEVIQGGSAVTYQFGGILYFSSTPDEIDFGLKNTGSYGAVTADNPVYDKPLVVGDSRVVPAAWELSVKTVEVMTSQTDTSLKLPNALLYKAGSTESVLRLNEPVVILAHKNAVTGVYDVSEEEWKKKGDGFKMSLKANDYRATSEYRATLLFTLSNTP
ncbi:pectate lyase-like adhesive domain-containing protein [Enterococcus crotali]|uniref:pectate lyase-like adhesive domain-containing protein n=1 Tax=Enterococcus crotali TaxID=1453587 RepID=UPI000471A218|nr:pectate lyase-like adhesive domain-containing protein [Enterococcus crotali]